MSLPTKSFGATVTAVSVRLAPDAGVVRLRLAAGSVWVSVWDSDSTNRGCESVLACFLVVIARSAFRVSKLGLRLRGSATLVLPGLWSHVQLKHCKSSHQRACRHDSVAGVSRKALGLLSLTKMKWLPWRYHLNCFSATTTAFSVTVELAKSSTARCSIKKALPNIISKSVHNSVIT